MKLNYEARLLERGKDVQKSRYLEFGPALVNTACLITFEFIYKRAVMWLVRIENHRTQEDFEASLSLKISLFQFFNCYLSSFCIAFWYRDFGELTKDLIFKLALKQLGLNLLEYSIHKCQAGRRIDKVQAHFKDLIANETDRYKKMSLEIQKAAEEQR